MIEEKKSIRPSGLSGNAVRTWGMLFLILGIAGRSIIQNQILGLGSVTNMELLAAMQADNSIMLFATLALVCQAVETCATPIFAFLLVEGFTHTSDFKNYLIRVAAVALVSEIPYNLAVGGSLLDLGSRNPAFGLVVCLIMMYLFSRYAEKRFANTAIKAAIVLAAIIWCQMLGIKDGNCLVAISAVFWAFRAKPMLRNLAGCAAAAVCSLFSFFYIASPMAFVVLHMYNSEPGARNRTVNYLSYPLILAAIALMAFVM